MLFLTDTKHYEWTDPLSAIITVFFKDLLTSVLRQYFAWCFAGSLPKTAAYNLLKTIVKVKLQIGLEQNTCHIISNNVLEKKKTETKLLMSITECQPL